MLINIVTKERGKRGLKYLWKEETSVAQKFFHIMLLTPSLLSPQRDGKKGSLGGAPLASKLAKLIRSEHKKMCEKLMNNNNIG